MIQVLNVIVIMRMIGVRMPSIPMRTRTSATDQKKIVRPGEKKNASQIPTAMESCGVMWDRGEGRGGVNGKKE